MKALLIAPTKHGYVLVNVFTTDFSTSLDDLHDFVSNDYSFKLADAVNEWCRQQKDKVIPQTETP